MGEITFEKLGRNNYKVVLISEGKKYNIGDFLAEDIKKEKQLADLGLQDLKGEARIIYDFNIIDQQCEKGGFKDRVTKELISISVLDFSYLVFIFGQSEPKENKKFFIPFLQKKFKYKGKKLDLQILVEDPTLSFYEQQVTVVITLEKLKSE